MQSPQTPSLTQAQAQQLGAAASSDIGASVAFALGNTATPFARRTQGNECRTTPAAPRFVACNTAITMNGDNTCVISGTYQCPDGGTVAVSGNETGNSTSANGTITATPANCSDGTLLINGDPSLTVTAQGSVSNNTTTVQLVLTGEISFAPVQGGQFPTGTCTANVTVNASNDALINLWQCSVSGSICGVTLTNANCGNFALP